MITFMWDYEWFSALQIDILHSVALGGLCDSEFPVTPGNCRHLAGLMLVRLWKGLSFIVVDSGHWLVRSFVLIPVGDSRRVTIMKSIEVWRGLWWSTVFYVKWWSKDPPQWGHRLPASNPTSGEIVSLALSGSLSQHLHLLSYFVLVLLLGSLA